MQRSGFGCHIHNIHMGSLSYAYDIIFISPSLYDLNRMLDICNKFAIDKCIIFFFDVGARRARLCVVETLIVAFKLFHNSNDR